MRFGIPLDLDDSSNRANGGVVSRKPYPSSTLFNSQETASRGPGSVSINFKSKSPSRSTYDASASRSYGNDGNGYANNVDDNKNTPTLAPMQHTSTTITIPQFSAFYDSIDKLMQTYTESISSKLGELGSKNPDAVSSDLDHVTSNFDAILKLQSGQVEEIIKQEQLEKKKKLDELKRKEALIAQQKEQARLEEEARIKKLAEEEARKKQAEKKAEKAAEAQRREREAQEAQKKAQLELDAKRKLNGTTNFASITKERLAYSEDIKTIKLTVVDQLSKESADLRKAVSSLKRKINVKFGQLSNSNQQLMKITQEVIQQIDDAKTNSHSELVYKWILNFVAKAIVSQAETEVIVKSTAALPLAKLSLSLLQKYPEFAYFFKARLIKKCPFIIGYTSKIDTEEGRILMGWRRRDSKWEDEVKYDERVAGICTLWAVITRIDVDKTGIDEMFTIAASWKFLARACNTSPALELLTNAHFGCLGNWWEACASNLLNAYHGQGRKMLQVVSMDLTSAVSSLKYPAAARLMIMGEDYFTNNKIETIKEMEY
ncbi:mRNA export factor Gle1p [[Candida] railenensis]|uniref:mRNA export factor GLE1 n=1 Tax=[Candida] railenensis TaxID=45579 RepID=A0A9P0QSB1_9ASCO|nr:mRNA export factor Gle1p [[Candida] railenensis]